MYCIVLYCIVLYCIVLYCIVLYCIVLYSIVLYCIVLYCIVLYCIVLYCITLYCIVLYCIVMFSKIDPHTHTCPKWQVCAEAFSIKCHICHNREREGSKKNKGIMNKYYRVETWKNYINYVWFRGVNDTAEFLSICEYLREILTVCILLHMNKGPRLVRLLEKRMSHILWHCPFKWYRKSIMLLVGC